MPKQTRLPRFIAIVTPGKEKRYRVFDRVSKNSYVATDDRQLAERLAREFSEKYSAPWYQRLFAWLFRRPLPQPAPDPIDAAEEPEVPEWKLRLERINALVEKHKQRARIAKGGHIVESDPIA